MPDWLNKTDAGLLSFSSQFSSKITATPTAFSLSAANATQYASAQSAYATALAAAQDPATKGPLATANKSIAKDFLISLTRHFAAQVQGAMTTTNSQRVELDLPIRDYQPSPLPVPGTLGMSILSVSGNAVTIKIFDPLFPDRKAKAENVAGATILSHIGAQPPDADGPWRFQGNCTTDRTIVLFEGPDAVAGAKVWITGFFFNPRGKSGFACAPISTTLQAGAVVSA